MGNHNLSHVQSASSRLSKRLGLGRATLGVILGASLAGCGTLVPWTPLGQPTAPPQGGVIAPSAFIGMKMKDVIAKLGQPTSVQPLQETTGNLMIYAHEGEPHYVFETGSRGDVVSATGGD